MIMPMDDDRLFPVFSTARNEGTAIYAPAVQPDVLRRLDKIRVFSSHHQDSIHLPSPLYHASLYAGLHFLDPDQGQGFGIWMQGNLKEAAHFAVSRSRNPGTGKNYDGANPTIYEIEPTFKNLAIFPDEAALYSFSVDSNADSCGLTYHEMRRSLEGAGYDGIFLLKEKTVAAMISSTLRIKGEHDAIPLYTTLVKLDLVSRFGKDPFPAP